MLNKRILAAALVALLIVSHSYAQTAARSGATQTNPRGQGGMSGGNSTKPKGATNVKPADAPPPPTVKDKAPTTGSSTAKSNTNNMGNVVDDIVDVVVNGGKFTQDDAAKAIKEALLKGITKGVDIVGKQDGYFKNPKIKIPFPKQFGMVESTMKSFGMSSLTDNFVQSMNRAAEGAAKQALPIFTGSIKQMTITDAVNIVSNKQPDAATKFLQKTTTEPLVSAFKPSIKTALDKSLATKYWKDITGYYNRVPFVQKVNTDLPDYVTRLAINGLFYMVGQEEAKIRKDPLARTSELLKKVFGGL